MDGMSAGQITEHFGNFSLSQIIGFINKTLSS